MKKSYLLLAAAATIMASCVETEKINNDLKATTEPKAIGFSSYSEKATKGVNDANDLEFYHNTFAVYGTKQSKNDNSIQYVFGGKATADGAQNGVTCSYQDPTLPTILGDWRYEGIRFWDKQADYDFIAYAPAVTGNPIRYYYVANAQVGDNGNWFKTTADYILKGTNLQATATKAEKVKGFNATTNQDLDLMISTSVAQNGSGHDPYVNLQFRHILSKLNVTIGQSAALYTSDVTIKEVKITGYKDKGSYNQENYNTTSNPKVSGWTASVDDNEYALKYNGSQVLDKGQYVDDDSNPATPDVYQSGDPFFFIESLVMPQGIPANQTKLTIKYNIASGSYNEDFTYTLDLYELTALREFYDGYNYYLKITIDPDIIKFDAQATVWDNQADVNHTIDK